jgi:MOSC domain-containing protein YiiM
VGTAIVQVSGPRGPCSKQERKLGLPGFLKRTIDSMRTGFYLKVLQSGIVNTGDNWDLQDRFDSAVSLELVNQAAYRPFEADVFGQVLRSGGLVPEWKDMLLAKLNGR